MTSLHPRLAEDCVVIGRFSLCFLLLMKDANYPWFILVPDRPDVCEIFQLSTDDQQQLMKESSQLSKLLMQAFNGDKMNIAAIGNIVEQLHIHHVVRYRDDPAWPRPVWGAVKPRPYDEAGLQLVLDIVHKLPLREFSFY